MTNALFACKCKSLQLACLISCHILCREIHPRESSRLDILLSALVSRARVDLCFVITAQIIPLVMSSTFCQAQLQPEMKVLALRRRRTHATSSLHYHREGFCQRLLVTMITSSKPHETSQAAHRLSLPDSGCTAMFLSARDILYGAEMVSLMHQH